MTLHNLPGTEVYVSPFAGEVFITMDKRGKVRGHRTIQAAKRLKTKSLFYIVKHDTTIKRIIKIPN